MVVFSKFCLQERGIRNVHHLSVKVCSTDQPPADITQDSQCTVVAPDTCPAGRNTSESTVSQSVGRGTDSVTNTPTSRRRQSRRLAVNGRQGLVRKDPSYPPPVGASRLLGGRVSGGRLVGQAAGVQAQGTAPLNYWSRNYPVYSS